MSAALDAIKGLFPDFGTARKERNRIRNRYRKNLTALERGEELFIISEQDYSPEYLNNWTEKHQVRADHLIQKHGSQSGPHFFRVNKSGVDEVRKALLKTIRRIRLQNYLSLFMEILLIILVLAVIGGAIYLGIAGFEDLAGLLNTPTQ